MEIQLMYICKRVGPPYTICFYSSNKANKELTPRGLIFQKDVYPRLIRGQGRQNKALFRHMKLFTSKQTFNRLCTVFVLLVGNLLACLLAVCLLASSQ